MLYASKLKNNAAPGRALSLYSIAAALAMASFAAFSANSKGRFRRADAGPVEEDAEDDEDSTLTASSKS